MVRGQGTAGYLGCVRTCPEASVFEDANCEAVTVPDYFHVCMTEQTRRFSVGRTILLIGGLVLGLLVLSASAQNQTQ
jgi:hypothetical protein